MYDSYNFYKVSFQLKTLINRIKFLKSRKYRFLNGIYTQFLQLSSIISGIFRQIQDYTLI